MTRRAALVTGGSAGIGLAIARLLVEEGHAVTLAARDPERLAAAVEELAPLGGPVEGVRANLATVEDLARAAATHRERFGRLDVLVSNAGVGLPGPIEQVADKQVDLQLNLNLRAAVLLLRECTPLLRRAGAEHGKALVVHVSSLFGKLPQPNVAVYSATKAALVALSAAAQAELDDEGVQVCALCPGWVDTPGTGWVEGVPRSRMIRAEDVAEAVRFLLRLSPTCRIPELTMVPPGVGP
jgi:NAD(P)-dependent dehydrogenase (short-subunit alcohol dehydrogenase family)